MILIGLGSNLPTKQYGAPADNLEAALCMMPERGINPHRISCWYRTKPVPASDQPDFVNGVAIVKTELNYRDLLNQLHDIERAFGRIRQERNEARVIDLDLLTYNDVQTDGAHEIYLPHPRLLERLFVLLPLREIAPKWSHPITKQPIDALLAGFRDFSGIELLD